MDVCAIDYIRSKLRKHSENTLEESSSSGHTRPEFIREVAIIKTLRALQLLLVLAALFFSGPPLYAASLNDDLAAAAKTYYLGEVDSAIQTLKSLIDQDTFSTPSERKVALEYLLDLCVGGFDLTCTRDYSPRYTQVVASIADVAEPLKLPFALQTGYYFGFAAWLSGDRSQAAAWLRAWPESGPEAPWSPRDYIRRQLLRAKLHLMLDETDSARLCVDRALMHIAAIQDSGSSLFELSVWLMDAIEDLLILGDTERAIGLSLTNAAVGQKIFPSNSVEFFKLLRISATAYQSAGMIPQALDAIERAETVLSHLHLSRVVQQNLSTDVETFAALMCLFAGDLPCAHRHLQLHPLSLTLPAMRSRGSLQSFPEVSYLASQVLIDVVGGANVRPDDLALLNKPINTGPSIPAELADAENLYRRLAHAIAVTRVDRDAADAELREVAPELLRLESKRVDAAGFLPRRAPIDELILSLVTTAYRAEDLAPSTGDTLLRLIELSGRNGQTFSSEALSLMSAARTDEIRNDVRDLLRLRSRRDSAERMDVARVLSSTPSIAPQGKTVPPVVDFKRRNIYSDFGSLIRRLSARIRNEQPDLSDADTPPSLEDIRGALADNEVLLGTRMLIGNVAGHFCVNRKTTRFTTSVEDVQALSRDERLLEASLLSQHARPTDSDLRYPISSARRIYDWLVMPLEGCFHAGDSIVWVGPTAGNLPLAALLTRGTATELESGRLATWPWLVNEVAISQVSTLSTFVALRRAQRQVISETAPQFLGVGDPRFSGLPEGPKDIGQLALRGAAGAAAVSVLPQLPDTRKEIVGIGTLFGERKTILFGEQATEATLRRLPLERYTYLEFATHGLVKEDIAGLTESALALTPISPTDSFDDGLLTASEIADLPLRARFIALSACNTAVLDINKFASEVPGLSAAFQVAGVPATLGTLWPVESKASEQIVRDVFRRLITDRVGPATALALAQRKYLQDSPSPEHGHPRFWAPFVVYGDGTTPSEGHAGTGSMQFGEQRLLTSSGGEVSSIVEGDDGSLFLRAMGDIRIGKRHASLTVKLHKDLSLEWMKEDPEIGNSPIALRLKAGTLIGGYRGGGESHSVAIMQFMDDTGRILQQWEVARPEADTYPVAALRTGAKSAIVAVVRHSNISGPNGIWPFDHLIIAELQVGQPLRVKADFEIASKFNPSHVGLRFLNDDVLVTITKPFGDTLPKGHWDEFHQFTSCGPEGYSTLTLLHRRSFSKLWAKELPSFQIANTVAAKDGSVWLVGSTKRDCGEGTRMALWELKRDRSLVELFTDQSPRDTQARGILQRSDGSVMLLGKSVRATDVDSYDERDPQRTIANSGRLQVSFSTRRIDDGVIVWLDPTLHEKDRVTLRTGSDLWITGAISAADHVWLYGELGNQAALLELTFSGPAPNEHATPIAPN